MQSSVRKHSCKREALLSILRGTECHPTAAWAFSELRQKYPDVSLATVYRNISEFREDGVLRSVGFVSGFERFDANMTPHDHFICTECGAVLDVFSKSHPELDKLRCETGLDIRYCDTSYYGICPNCKRRENSGDK